MSESALENLRQEKEKKNLKEKLKLIEESR
jgi:hypothetical protein